MSEQYIVDTSVLIQAFIEDSESRRASTLIYRAGTEQITIHTFDFSLVESANMLWKRVGAGSASRDAVKQLLKIILEVPLTMHTVDDLLEPAIEIALDHRLAVYDAVPIALAVKLDTPFITVDQKQGKAAAAVGVMLKPITDFPEYQNP